MSMIITHGALSPGKFSLLYSTLLRGLMGRGAGWDSVGGDSQDVEPQHAHNLPSFSVFRWVSLKWVKNHLFRQVAFEFLVVCAGASDRCWHRAHIDSCCCSSGMSPSDVPLQVFGTEIRSKDPETTDKVRQT